MIDCVLLQVADDHLILPLSWLHQGFTFALQLVVTVNILTYHFHSPSFLKPFTNYKQNVWYLSLYSTAVLQQNSEAINQQQSGKNKAYSLMLILAADAEGINLWSLCACIMSSLIQQWPDPDPSGLTHSLLTLWGSGARDITSWLAVAAGSWASQLFLPPSISFRNHCFLRPLSLFLYHCLIHPTTRALSGPVSHPAVFRRDESCKEMERGMKKRRQQWQHIRACVCHVRSNSQLSIWCAVWVLGVYECESILLCMCLRKCFIEREARESLRLVRSQGSRGILSYVTFTLCPD